MANEAYLAVNDSFLQSGAYTERGSCIVGHWTGDATDGALRFTNLAIAKNGSINIAYLVYKYAGVGGSGQWRFRTRGIAQDNTADFSSDPMGRTKTTAAVTTDEGQPTSGGTKSINVKSILEEITARGGWSSGNAVGFIMDDQGSDTNVYAGCNEDESYLVYRLAAEPNFTPTPVTVAAPSLPTPRDYGFKIAKPNVNVLTASEEDLFYSTNKMQFKVVAQQQVTTSANPHVITHNLGYKPFAEAFAKSGSVWIRCPYLGLDTNYATPYIEITSTELKIHVAIGTVVYYYIFLDQLGA